MARNHGRPVSLYDNLERRENNGSIGAAVSAGNLAPSMATCMSTTVPQNIAASNISGKHVPTRSSLRHSRMVQTRAHMPVKSDAPFLHHHRLAIALSALKLMLGLAVSSLAVWLLVWAPNLHLRDIPYWSGLPLLASGMMGLMLLCCCHKDNPGIPQHLWDTSLKMITAFLGVLASLTCFCACVFALLHLVFLSYMSCEPKNVLHSSCVCKDIESGRARGYLDLNCVEVENILTILLTGSCAANGIGGILSAWYVFLHWSGSQHRHLYSKVRTSTSKHHS